MAVEVKEISPSDQVARNDCFRVRFEVFVKEQHVPEAEEIDEYDDTAWHFAAYEDDQPIGTGRLRFLDGYGKVERICVLASHRHTGAGKLIMDAIEQKAQQEGAEKMKLHAQTTAAGFYEKLSYDVTSGEFMDAGIPHVEMKKQLS
ncbi:Predicted N-acyltransferase, GNAT family [Alteribacillus persepolensis]|uniref:Predicted N-acyltransferase, GNAT family n=1 Tax=Alteribacillus persepolensis TaxID=568899 RepID=A0A1G8ERI1_9BACI|nr:GNAT family N-acetyltransferase [Alteribacillus persepolensis]SDH72427.1 Predicted N-acyltransferase, GNAT family [Alteribacillus persepolensis]